MPARKFKYIGISPRCEEERLSSTGKPTGRYRARFPVNGRYTTKILKATTKREAIKEAQDATASTADDFATLASLYRDNDCPNAELIKIVDDSALKEETARVETLIEYFGKRQTESLDLSDIRAFKEWRVRQVRYGSGLRTVDKDTQTLSNIYRYGVLMKLVKANPFAQGRPRYQKEKNIRHSRQVAPHTGDQIHAMAELHLDHLRSEVMAWVNYFEMFTGCRISELLRCRLDAANPDQSGFIEWLPKSDDPKAPLGLLYYSRNKGGIDPWSIIGPEFAQMIRCFQHWHKDRFPKSPWFFPCPDGKKPVTRRSVGRAIERAANRLGYQHITPHGFRSFYVTKRRSDGEKDNVISGEIGDKTYMLMHHSYGNRPKVWSGRGEPISWLPKQGLPGWLRFQPESAKIARIA